MNQLHIAFAAFTPAFYRWEVQRMLPVTYPGATSDQDTHMEPDVGQVEDGLLPEDAIVGDPVWAVYGRRTDGIAEHISDLDELEDALALVRSLGCSAINVIPGPTSECHGRQVKWINDSDSSWDDHDWKVNVNHMVSGMGANLSEVINNYAEAWRVVFDDDSYDVPYKAQHLLEELIRKMQEAV